jgi:hypothetical protein
MSNLEASNLFSVKGMVFVITGGGSGILLLFIRGVALANVLRDRRYVRKGA